MTKEEIVEAVSKESDVWCGRLTRLQFTPITYLMMLEMAESYRQMAGLPKYEAFGTKDKMLAGFDPEPYQKFLEQVG